LYSTTKPDPLLSVVQYIHSGLVGVSRDVR
jgi:hypothetical protein